MRIFLTVVDDLLVSGVGGERVAEMSLSVLAHHELTGEPAEVEPGQQVAEGETLVVLEAMKMEHRITADTEGVIDQVLVTPGQSVEAHQVLVTFAAGGEDD